MYSTAYKEMSVDWRFNRFWTVALLSMLILLTRMYLIPVHPVVANLGYQLGNKLGRGNLI